MREGRPAASEWHSALAVLLPFLFLQAEDAIVRQGISAGAIPMPPGSLLVVLLMGASRMVIAGWLSRERITGALPLVREVVLLLIASWLLLTLLSGRPFRGDFSPLHPDLAWPLALCLAQWLLTLYVRNALRPREMFLSLVKGRDGHALVAAARDAGDEAGESCQGLGRLTTLAVLLEVFSILPYVGVSTVLAMKGSPAPGPAITARLLLFSAAGVAFMVVVNGFRAEQELCLAGIAPDPKKSVARSAGPCAGIAGLFAVALCLSGRKALLPLSAIRRFFEWLASLWPTPGPVRMEQVAAPPGGITGTGGLADMMGKMEAAPNPLIGEILRIAGIVLGAAAAAAFLWFIVRPLFSRETRRSLRRMHLLAAAARRARALLRLIARIPGALTRIPGALAAWARSPGRRLSAIPGALIAGMREAAADTRRAAEGTARASRSRAVRELRRLARWGRKAGVAFTETEGPMEYIRLLAAAAPEKAAALSEAGLLFEELVYAESSAGRGERGLARIVDGIVR